MPHIGAARSGQLPQVVQSLQRVQDYVRGVGIKRSPAPRVPQGTAGCPTFGQILGRSPTDKVLSINSSRPMSDSPRSARLNSPLTNTKRYSWISRDAGPSRHP